jgi:hypothetical protein
VSDAEALSARGLDVLLYVAVWIHDHGLASPLAADHIARLSERKVIKTLKEHR